ncbi:alpha-N-acetylglucosaminidase [Streptomyces thermolilacinus]|uniref:Alpha-N-acetylglucosaminidase n=1 Tax=Streptomyces thermolilacinus SPC6 TaxID=1306406 RepID=A0A1D3DW21_9ACTN|nr:alpha-N-acetylglucosaminidase [Streptomyces thermolilacinus]OEJ96520.1 alpha-N-acetylglucosaminidase [Streptomyces thermolilacinus SPC6]
MSRRVLLGTAGAAGATAALAGHTATARTATDPVAGTARTATAADPVAAARAALHRVLPADRADQFTLVRLRSGPERFRVTGVPGRVEVAGTGPVALLTGVHWYLKYVCRAPLTWCGSRPELPRVLPAPPGPLAHRATVPHRFVLNDTHDGYTAPYADWPRWERLIDLLALHGCNEVLVTTGAEAVYHRLLREYGYTDAETRAWLPAPSHQPWWLLQNLSGYGGPPSPDLLARRAALGRRIAGRLRELGMSPVLPGFFGTVPDGFADRVPGARTVPQGTWAGMRRPDWLDPRTDAFRRVAAAYHRHQRELFGEARYVKMDLLHEGGSPGDVPVPDAARAVEAALRAALPEATWVMLGWQANPRRELLDALDRSRLLVVDGLSDLEAVTDRERDWGGTPYAFGSIPNFGGRTTLGAATHRWAGRFTAWRDRPGSALTGTAYMPEAAERDPAAFELFTELAWRERPVEPADWFARWADARYGAPDASARAAFTALGATAYRLTSTDARPHDSVFAARPSLAARSGAHYATRSPAYDPAAFDAALAALLGVREELRGSEAYRYDLTDVTRQALANRSWQLIGQLDAAYAARDPARLRRLAALWLRLMRLADDVAGAHRAFLLGPWLAEARREGLEHTARTLLTSWADRAAADGGRLAGYANRDWAGLIADVYLPRWRAYLEEVEDALAQGRAPRRADWYAAEEAWSRGAEPYAVRPSGDPYRTALRVRDVLARAPYQGAVTVVSDPPALVPGGAAEVTVAFRNTSGLRGTGPVELALDCPAFGSLPAHRVGPVPAAGTADAVWRVTAPAGPLTDPVEPLPYTVRAVYGPAGERPVTARQRGELYAAGPLGAGWRTYTSNGAVFGRLGGRYAVNGGGRDLWRRVAEFGAFYREGCLAEGGAPQVRVAAQAATGPWARAGIVVRNALAVPGAPGLLYLAVTPARGVALAWDADGDGALDTYRQVPGVAAPVLLRLVRASGAYTGACSTDGGATWRTVATVPVRDVPGAAAVQDAGVFMTAAHGGSGARGTAVFEALAGWGAPGAAGGPDGAA